MSMIPRCHRFRPTQQEVIELFLMRRAMNQPLIDGYQIIERSLYGEQSPWDVFSEDDPWEICTDSNQKVIYCFSKVISKGGHNMTRIGRTAGCGTWDGKAVSTKITSAGGKVIGYKRAFTFKTKKGCETEDKGRWIMHEFSLAEPHKYIDQDCVICRISVQYAAKAGNGSDDEENEEQANEEDSGASHEQSRKRKSGKSIKGLASKSKGLDKEKIQESRTLTGKSKSLGKDKVGEIAQGSKSNPINLEAAVDGEALNNPAEVDALCELSLAPAGHYPRARVQHRPPSGPSPPAWLQLRPAAGPSPPILLQPRPAAGPYPPSGSQLRPPAGPYPPTRLQHRPEEPQIYQYILPYQHQRPWWRVSRSPVTYKDLMISASQNQQVIPDSDFGAHASSSSGVDVPELTLTNLQVIPDSVAQASSSYGTDFPETSQTLGLQLQVTRDVAEEQPETQTKTPDRQTNP